MIYDLIVLYAKKNLWNIEGMTNFALNFNDSFTKSVSANMTHKRLFQKRKWKEDFKIIVNLRLINVLDYPLILC